MNRRAISRTIVCLFLIFAVSGIGGAYAPFSVHPAYAAKAKKKGGEGESTDPNAPHPDYEYIDLKPLILPVITDRGLTQQVSLMVSIEVPYGKTEEVHALEPKLADAYLQDLYGALGNGSIMVKGGSAIDIAALKQRLEAVTTRVLGPDKVHDILLQVVQQRPM